MGDVDRTVLMTHRKVLTESYVLGNGAPSFPASVCAVCIPGTAPWTLEDGLGWRWQGKITRTAKRAVLSTGWAAFVRQNRAEAGDVVEFVFHPGNVLRLVRRSYEEKQQDVAAQPPPEQQPQPGASVPAASQACGEHDSGGTVAVLSGKLQARRRERKQYDQHQRQPGRQQGEQQMSSQPALPAGNAAAKRRSVLGASAAQALEERHHDGGCPSTQPRLEAGSAPGCEVKVQPRDTLPAMRCLDDVQRGPQFPDSSAAHAAGGSNGEASLREAEPSRAGEHHSCSAHYEGTSDLTQARVAGVVGSRDNVEAVPTVPSVRPAAGSMARARQHLRWRRVTGGQLQGLSDLQRNVEHEAKAPLKQSN